jgi:SHS2 domain-containing protein
MDHSRSRAPVQASHEIVDHASEVRLRIRAGSMSELLAEAGRALAEVQLRESGGASAPKWRDIEVSAPDRAALLAEWLNELIFLGETEAWVPVQFELARATDTSARVRASPPQRTRMWNKWWTSCTRPDWPGKWLGSGPWG